MHACLPARLQEKSYFAVRLPHGWWLFGLDLALVDDIDMCQYRWVGGWAVRRQYRWAGGRYAGSAGGTGSAQVQQRWHVACLPRNMARRDGTHAVQLTCLLLPCPPPPPLPGCSYFARIAEERLGPDDQVVLVQHCPDWLVDWFWGHTKAKNLRQLVRGPLAGRARVQLAGERSAGAACGSIEGKGSAGDGRCAWQSGVALSFGLVVI